jgi:tetratricopeptide (TPR) repeat protein
LDTNVLLADPQVILAFPDAEVVIPETVLGELDKLKTTRTDQDVRYRGREISRELFELSAKGRLADGVPLEHGGTLSVVSVDPAGELPGEYSAKSSDDRILAVAYQLARQGRDVTLVTNDLNMLLKAQAVDLPVQRYEDQRPPLVRATLNVWRRNKSYVLTGFVFAFAFISLFYLVYVIVIRPTQTSSGNLPSQVEQQLSSSDLKRLEAEATLRQDPKNVPALITLGDYHYGLAISQDSPDHWRQAAGYYERAVALIPNDPRVGTDLAVAHFYLGNLDRAISLVQDVIERNPQFEQAYFNYGTFLHVGKGDLRGALAQYKKALKLATAGSEEAQELTRRISSIETSLAGGAR